MPLPRTISDVVSAPLTSLSPLTSLAPARSPVVVVGAGPSGLATAAELRRAGVPAVVLERAPHIAASWRTHYSHLRLHTTRGLSRLPGLPIPRRYGTWVGRDDLVTYLEQYAAHHALEIRLNTPVHRLECLAGRGGDAGGPRWRVHTALGAVPARAVVVATGRNHTAHLPDWPGADTFHGNLLHSSRYLDPRPYEGRSVLVVGGGNSGAEIAVALGRRGAARVWWSVRTPPTIVPRAVDRWQAAGVLAQHLPPALGDRATALLQRLTVPDLSGHGLPRPREGMYTRAAREEVTPVHDRGLVEAVRSGRVLPVAAVVALDGPEVLLADGTRLTPEDVVAATGYRCALAGLVGPLPVLDPSGLPLVRGARTSPAAPQLYFAGYGNPLSGALRHVRGEARQIARAIRRAGRPAWRPWALPAVRRSGGRLPSPRGAS
ncbi:flavin-containing monooxygenase [Streptomyces sp. URMC 123]|uniref:flavin-containing monooxygenase n=1 Tax=Streptomyces sp. URMC 123 TaxID=3423403 RepID=UPI003F1D6AA5